MEQSALTTLTPPVLNLNSTAIEIPLTFKQDEISEEVSYTGFVPVELPYYIDTDDAIVKRWEIICQIFFSNLKSFKKLNKKLSDLEFKIYQKKDSNVCFLPSVFATKLRNIM